MSTEYQPPKSFKIKFFTDLKAFDIYKSNNDGSVDTSYPLHDLEDRWQFNWNDSLKIDWDGDGSGPNYFLKFKRLNSNKDAQLSGLRKNPVKEPYTDDRIEIQRNETITFIKHDNAEAEWGFDFYWGESKDVDLTVSNTIDPNAKVRDTPY